MIFWHQIAHDFTQPRVAKVACSLITATLVLSWSFYFDQEHWERHQALKLSISRHQPLSEGVAATSELARRLWGYRYAQGLYMAIGEGLVSVFLYTVL